MYGVRTDENGLYYMRTRYYNVAIKRFINADTEKGSIDVSQSLNRYCYVQGNLVSYIDPFGLSPSFNLCSFAHGMKLIENAVTFTVSAGHAAETAKGMWQKYAEDKKPAGMDTLGEAASLGLSMFAAGSSAKQFVVNGNKLRSMKVKEKIGSNVGKIAGKVKSGAGTLWHDNRGIVDFEAPVLGSGSNTEIPWSSGTVSDAAK